jgi:GT2 family glycosyltransferase
VLAHAGGSEILVVDDASQDDTAAALASLAASQPSVTVWRLEEQRGFSRAANCGLRRATGDLLLLLNSDTALEPGAASVIEAAFAADARLGVLGASLHYPNGLRQWSGGREPGLLWLFALASGIGKKLGAARRAMSGDGSWREPPELLPVDWVSGAAMTIRRQTFSGCGGLDESFNFYAQDLDFCRRARDAGWRIAVGPRWRVLHLHGATVGGVASGTLGRQRLDYLWSDLLLWVHRRHGSGRARVARQALLLGGTLRLVLAKPAAERDAVRAAITRVRHFDIHG